MLRKKSMEMLHDGYILTRLDFSAFDNRMVTPAIY